MRRWVIAGVVLGIPLACFALLALSPVLTGEVYLPDLFARQPIEVGQCEHDGVQFKITQFWRDDFYTTQLIHSAPGGATTVRVLDSDDDKHWSCDIQFDDDSQKIVIRFPRDARYWEYWWDTKRLVRHQETGPIELYPAS